MVNDACLKYATEEHFCPHCKTKLSCCNTPPMHVGDGLGWGTDIFFICLNDDCSLFINGWKHVEAQYGQAASYRYMKLPNEEKGSPMMVRSSAAFTGCTVDVDEVKEQNTRYQTEKESIEKLKTCVAEKNLEPILFLITDEESNLDSRRKACELIEEVCDIACIDPIRNHKFRHTEIQQFANIGISKMLKKSFQKECPNCAEIIKAQAKRCKHCGK